MGKLNVYSVYDKKAAAYVTPLFMLNDDVAIRSFLNSCKEPSHEFHNHPEDYRMVRLGTFDDVTAKFELDIDPVEIVTALEAMITLKKEDLKQQRLFAELEREEV